MNGLNTIDKVQSIDGDITAKTPIHVGGDGDTGNQSLLRRQVFYKNGNRVDIPIIPGNSIRGHLRRLLIKDLMSSLDYTFKDEDLYFALYSGGRLKKASSTGTLDKTQRKSLRKLLPPISLLGTALGNQMISGVVNIGHALPKCGELSDRFEDKSLSRIGEYTDFEFSTRSDSNPDEEGFDIEFDFEETNDPIQMKYGFEVFIPGTQFGHTFTLESHATELEKSCLIHAIDLWRADGIIGGKSSSGYGRIGLDYGISGGSDEYVKHIENNETEIIQFLDRL